MIVTTVLVVVSCLTGDLLEHPVDVTNNRVEIGEVHAWSKGVGPPTEA